MIDYKKYKLMKECIDQTFEVYAGTLDVADYVPMEHIEKTHKWILKNMKKQQCQIDKENRKYQKSLKKLIKLGYVIDTTSQEYVLGDIDPSYINFHRAPSLMSGQPTAVVLTESVAEENTVTNEEHAEGDVNVEEREEK